MIASIPARSSKILDFARPIVSLHGHRFDRNSFPKLSRAIAFVNARRDPAMVPVPMLFPIPQLPARP